MKRDECLSNSLLLKDVKHGAETGAIVLGMERRNIDGTLIGGGLGALAGFSEWALGSILTCGIGKEDAPQTKNLPPLTITDHDQLD